MFYRRNAERLQEIVFFEEGEPLLDGETGELKLHVVTTQHAKFERDRHDLKCNLTITLLDALVGFSTEVRFSCFLRKIDEPRSSLCHAQRLQSSMCLLSKTSLMRDMCVQFEHLDGHKVKLEASEVTIPGQVFKVEKEGMPMFDHPDKTGDMYVTITVAFPKKLSQSQKDQVRKQFSQLHDEL